jgi:hypothetical protein
MLQSLKPVGGAPARVPLLREPTENLIVAQASRSVSDVGHVEPGSVSVSGYRLEQYLNGCTPTCHG